MYEDFLNSDENTKAELLQLWGYPEDDDDFMIYL